MEEGSFSSLTPSSWAIAHCNPELPGTYIDASVAAIGLVDLDGAVSWSEEPSPSKREVDSTSSGLL